MKCLKHEQEYTTYEWCVYCGQPQAAALIKPKLSIGDKYKDGIIVSVTDNELLICKPQDEPNEMSWSEAMKLNDGWILPTKDELNLMYINKDKIGGFSSNYYWSSTEANTIITLGTSISAMASRATTLRSAQAEYVV